MSDVLLERPEEKVAVLRLNRPEARNAINDTVRGLIVEHLRELDRDKGTSCVVLTGGERYFAAGADLRDLSTMNAADVLAGPGEAAYAAIARFSKPLIAAVNGYALGAGVELAMHADIIVAGEGARFAQPEIRVGIMPGAGATQRLPRAVGKYKAMRLLLTGEAIGAREADAMGLVTEVVPDTEVLSRALELARTIAAMPPIAVRQIKRVVIEGSDLPLAAGLMLERQAFTLLFDTKDQKEGMRAYLEKRSPVFRGE